MTEIVHDEYAKMDMSITATRKSYFYQLAKVHKQQNVIKEEENKCRQLFHMLDTNGIGMLHRTTLIYLLESSLRNYRLDVQGTDVITLVDLFMKDCKSYMEYDDFQKVYHQHLVGNESRLASRSRRCSIATTQTKKKKESVAQDSNWMENHKLEIMWLLGYFVLNVGCFMWKFWKYFYHQPAAYELSGIGLPIARGFAQVCLLNCLLIMLPLIRGVMQYIRESKTLREYIPVDSNISFHATCGYTLIISGVAHSIAQVYAYCTKVMTASDQIWFASSLAKSNAFPGPRPNLWNLACTIPGITGMTMLTCIVLATPFTLQAVRKNNFNWFWYSHYLYYPIFLGALWPHGIQSWLEPSQAWLWLTVPVLLYILDRRHRYKVYRKTKQYKILSAEINAGTLALQIEKPKLYTDYKPGMYIYLNVPILSKFEWHPFTITSSPSDEFLSVHIREAGDWTNALHYLIKQHLVGLKPEFPVVRIDGPVGTATQEYLKYDTVVMIGGGIGVTPFASILRDTALRLKESQCKGCGMVNYTSKISIKKLYFHWCTREQNAFSWFSDCLNKVTELDSEDRIEINTHLTNIEQDPATAALKMFQTFAHNLTGHDVLSGLKTKTRTHFGRTDWDVVFRRIIRLHPNENVGVFFCGSPAFKSEIQNMCRQHSDNVHHVTFDFLPESF